MTASPHVAILTIIAALTIVIGVGYLWDTLLYDNNITHNSERERKTTRLLKAPAKRRRLSHTFGFQQVLPETIVHKTPSQASPHHASTFHEQITDSTTDPNNRPTTIQTTPLLTQLDNLHLRHAAFGTSTTYGATLPDRHTQTYIKLLSPTATNLALPGPAGGANYPSACTQSLVGALEWDVIVLEFHAVHDGLRVLTRRLRERFPRAIIIILAEWHPSSITNQEGISAAHWAKAHFGENAIHNSQMHHAFLNSADRWHWEGKDEHRRDVKKEICQEYGAYFLRMRRPTDPRQWVKHAHLFSEDFYHKSVEGHKDVANRIRGLLIKLLLENDNESDEYQRMANYDDHANVIPVMTNSQMVSPQQGLGTIPSSSLAGKWSSNDSCISWLESGDITGIRMSDNMDIHPFSNKPTPFSSLSHNPPPPSSSTPSTTYYAIELTKGVGSITLSNPSPHPLTLYVSYMVTGPGQSRYPRVKATLWRSGEVFHAVDIHQNPPLGDFAPVHVHVVQRVGVVESGSTLLQLKQLEESPWPFRLVGVVMTNENFKFSGGPQIQMNQ